MIGDPLLFDNHVSDDEADNNTKTTVGGSTGRWTREEHNLFLKGLEMHGKGWKKIASLIKTRTVVQIRTHAQKYFLKLQKARQNGGSGNISMDGKSGYRKKRRRMSGKPVALAPPLKPYIVPRENGVSELLDGTSNGNEMGNITINNDGASSINSIGIATTLEEATAKQIAKYEEAENGIFNFLSPPLNIVSDNNNNSSNNNSSDSRGSDSGNGSNISNGNSSTDNSLNLSSNNNGNNSNESIFKVPDWYKQGKGVASLLKDAEGLNWLIDQGSAVPPKAHTVNMPRALSSNTISSRSNLPSMAPGSTLSDAPNLTVGDMDIDFGVDMMSNGNHNGVDSSWINNGDMGLSGGDNHQDMHNLDGFDDFFNYNGMNNNHKKVS